MHKKGAMQWEEVGKILIVVLIFLVLLAIIVLLKDIFLDKLGALKDALRFR